jgi:hypothetical protein
MISPRTRAPGQAPPPSAPVATAAFAAAAFARARARAPVLRGLRLGPRRRRRQLVRVQRQRARQNRVTVPARRPKLQRPFCCALARWRRRCVRGGSALRRPNARGDARFFDGFGAAAAAACSIHIRIRPTSQISVKVEYSQSSMLINSLISHRRRRRHVPRARSRPDPGSRWSTPVLDCGCAASPAAAPPSRQPRRRRASETPPPARDCQLSGAIVS